MTVLASRFTEEGAAIVADGRRIDGESGRVITGTGQKIAFGELPNFSFAFGWAGISSFDCPSGKKYSLQSLTLESIDELRPTRFDCAVELIESIVRGVHERVVHHVQGAKIPTYAENERIAHLLVVGYFKTQPIEAAIHIRSRDGVLMGAEWGHFASPPSGCLTVVSGSMRIAEGMNADESTKSLPEAEKLLLSYAQQCIDGRGRFIDCEGFGGHIHLARVTPQGCHWVRPPKGDNANEQTHQAHKQSGD